MGAVEVPADAAAVVRLPFPADEADATEILHHGSGTADHGSDMARALERRRKGSGQVSAKACPHCQAWVTIDPRQIKVRQGSQVQVCPECRGFVPMRRSDLDRLPPTDDSTGIPLRPLRLRSARTWARASLLSGGSVTRRTATSGRDKRPALARAAMSGSASALNSLFSRLSGTSRFEADETDRAEANAWMSQAVANVDSDLMLRSTRRQVPIREN